MAIRLTTAAAAAIVLALALKRPARPTAATLAASSVGGALVHGLALSTGHAALISVAATPTALVHAFHPILTAALGVLILSGTFACHRFRTFLSGSNRSAWVSAVTV